jgi:hypothetical protein
MSTKIKGIEYPDDLMEIFFKPVTEMTDDEIEASLRKLNLFRIRKFTKARKKTWLDKAMSLVDEKTAKVIAQKYERIQEELDGKETKASENGEEKENQQKA